MIRRLAIALSLAAAPAFAHLPPQPQNPQDTPGLIQSLYLQVQSETGPNLRICDIPPEALSFPRKPVRVLQSGTEVLIGAACVAH